jgi:hypothetical protein
MDGTSISGPAAWLGLLVLLDSSGVERGSGGWWVWARCWVLREWAAGLSFGMVWCVASSVGAILSSYVVCLSGLGDGGGCGVVLSVA